MGQEVELKLQLTPDGPAAVRGLLGVRSQHTSLHATYFDTAGHDLSAAGLSLRIRVGGDKTVQTVKAAGRDAAGLFTRAEWEREVSDRKPELDPSMPIATLLGNRVGEIQPLFNVLVERQIWHHHDERGAVEIALDVGEVVAGDRRSRICEIEFELQSGDAATLFTLARRIAAATPVKLSIHTKAERGYRLLEPIGCAVKAEPSALQAGTTAAEAFQHSAHACLRHFRLNEDLLDDHRDEAALHQARVALRRLRSAFSVWQAMLHDSQDDLLRDHLRWLSGILGEARNLDVLIPRVGTGPMRDRLTAEREAAYDQVEIALRSSRARGLMLDLGEWLAAGAWLRNSATDALRSQPAEAFAQAILGRYRRKVKRRGRKLERISDGSRHELRKAAKKLRYAADFLGGLFDRAKQVRCQQRFVTRLANLQDHLGALNDLTTAYELIKAYGLGEAPTDEMARAQHAKPKIIAKAANAHGKFVEAKRFWS